MKFKYLGQNGTFSLELVAYGIMGKGEYLRNGQILDVPDKNTTVINSLEASGLFERVNYTPNKSKITKQENKKVKSDGN